MSRTAAEQWAKRVERWKDSGLTAKEFAAEAGLNASTLTYWRWKLAAAVRSGDEPARGNGQPAENRGVRTRKKSVRVSPKLVELPIATLAPTVPMLEVVLGDVRVRVSAGFDEATLTRVVRALEAAR